MKKIKNEKENSPQGNSLRPAPRQRMLYPNPELLWGGDGRSNPRLPPAPLPFVDIVCPKIRDNP